MKTNHARAKLKRGDPSIGTWLTLPDTIAARLMARVGFDWLTVELEHTPIDLETAADGFWPERQQRTHHLGARKRARYVRPAPTQVLAKRHRLGGDLDQPHDS